MAEDQEPHEYLFSLTNTNKHSAGRRLKPKEQVEFKGAGVVVGEVREGYASDEREPTITYRITCDYLELTERP